MCALLNVFLIALMVQSGLAIKCYNCDSASNEGCANMTDKNIIAEECTYEKHKEVERQYNNHNRNWLLQISDITYHPLKGDSDYVRMVCQKIVGIDEHKQRTTVRRCQLANIDPCDSSRKKLLNPNREIECHLCEEDKCNGSSNNQVSGVIIGVVAVVTISMRLIL